MILYIDESINNDYFVVGGFLCRNDYSTNKMCKRFRNRVKCFSMNTNDKRRILNEMKSIYIDTSYPELKRDMLKMMRSISSKYVYAYLRLNQKVIKQNEKETIYLNLLKAIVDDIDEDIVILFDQFKKKDFETRIIDTISPIDKVILIENKNSISCKGIQLADNVCSAIRRHLCDTDNNKFYETIKDDVLISIEMEMSTRD